MKEIVVSTDNKNKIYEIRKKLEPLNYKVLSKSQAGYENINVIEDGESLEENAQKKVHPFNDSKRVFIGDDTGLFVHSLNGRPGILSARFAGENASDKANRLKLLTLMKRVKNRDAFFKTVIAIKYKDKTYLVEGVCQGIISDQERGEAGFGYDSLFIPKGQSESFAQMDTEKKNIISHRAKALEELLSFLKKLREE